MPENGFEGYSAKTARPGARQHDCAHQRDLAYRSRCPLHYLSKGVVIGFARALLASSLKAGSYQDKYGVRPKLLKVIGG